MLNRVSQGASHIYLACGSTDFRKQADSLVQLIHGRFQRDAYNSDLIFLFCNRQRTAIKALRYDHNGFALLSKKLLGDMKYQWPRTAAELKEITPQQVRWLTEGLEIEPKRAHKRLAISRQSSCY